MAVLGTGIDIVEIARLEETIKRNGERFLGRVFTDAERAYCSGRPRPILHFAGRFAAKEAALKAIRTGWVKGISWKDVEVTLGPKGEPSIRLSGGAFTRAQQIGIDRIHVSISHSDTHAVACAVAEGKPLDEKT